MPAAESEKQGPGPCQVFHRGNAFGRGQLSMVVVIQVAMQAAFVAAVCQIKMATERPALFYRARDETVHHGRGPGCGGADQHASPPRAETVPSNLLENISSRSDSPSAIAQSPFP